MCGALVGGVAEQVREVIGGSVRLCEVPAQASAGPSLRMAGAGTDQEFGIDRRPWTDLDLHRREPSPVLAKQVGVRSPGQPPEARDVPERSVEAQRAVRVRRQDRS
jgi:hypothetical protein